MSLLGQVEAFAKTTVGAAVIAFVFTTLLGGLATYEFTQLQAKAAFDAEQRKADAANRAELVNNVTRLLSERKTYAGLVISAIRHQAPDAEVKARWDAYQAAYVDYNTTLYKYKSTTGLLMGLDIGQKLNKPFDDYITVAFTRIDACITEAYALYMYKHQNAEAIAKLENCDAKHNTTTFRIGDEMLNLQGCIATYDTVLMTSIFLENEYDKLPGSQRRVPPDDAPVNTASDAADMDLKCRSGDVLCRRIAAYGGISGQIAKGCENLARMRPPGSDAKS